MQVSKAMDIDVINFPVRLYADTELLCLLKKLTIMLILQAFLAFWISFSFAFLACRLMHRWQIDIPVELGVADREETLLQSL